MIVKNKDKGLTLIELSIVIIITGLIFTGVVSARNIIVQTKFRQELSNLQKVNLAVTTFNNIYKGLPGDFQNASSYWPTATSGDGDYRLEKTDGSINMATGLYSGEVTHAFEHLSLAELLPKKYDSSIIINRGFPSSVVLPNMAITLASEYSNTFWVDRCNPSSGKLYILMAYTDTNRLPSLNDADTYGLHMSSKHAYYLDRKIDNGKASDGRYISVNFDGVVSGGCHDAGNYTIEQQDVCRSCILIE